MLFMQFFSVTFEEKLNIVLHNMMVRKKPFSGEVIAFIKYFQADKMENSHAEWKQQRP